MFSVKTATAHRHPICDGFCQNNDINTQIFSLNCRLLEFIPRFFHRIILCFEFEFFVHNRTMANGRRFCCCQSFAQIFSRHSINHIWFVTISCQKFNEILHFYCMRIVLKWIFELEAHDCSNSNEKPCDMVLCVHRGSVFGPRAKCHSIKNPFNGCLCTIIAPACPFMLHCN